MKKCTCFSILLCLLCFSAMGQTARTTPTESTLSSLSSKMDKRNAVYTGSIMQEFNAINTEGWPFNNASLRNKVTILVFWYPSCNCLHFCKLDSVANMFKERKDFQIVALGADTFDLASYKRTSYMPYTYATLSSYYELRQLNYNNGIPTIFVINRDGVIVKILGAPNRDYTTLAGTIRELML